MIAAAFYDDVNGGEQAAHRGPGRSASVLGSALAAGTSRAGEATATAGAERAVATGTAGAAGGAADDRLGEAVADIVSAAPVTGETVLTLTFGAQR